MSLKNPLVSFTSVSFAYREVEVLKDISFSIYPGEFIAIIGPNGGGKTTLLKLLMGFFQPKHGKISIFNENISKEDRSLAYVPQNLKYDRQFPISVLEVVLEGRISKLPWYRRYRKEDREIARDSLRKVGLVGMEKKAFGELSGGQAQRVLIARALATEPSLILLDEPTANVDSQTEKDIYELLSHLHQEKGVTILMVTHHLQEIIHRVDKVLCVQRTSVLLDPADVCRHFAYGVYHAPLK